MSALVSFVYDVTMMIIGDEELGCSGVFLHMQELYSPIFGLFMVVKFLVPIWTMLFVFQPIEMVPDQEDLLPAISEDGNCTSVFSPPYEQQRNHYKAMHYPTVTTPDVAESPTLPGQLRRSASNLTPINEEVGDINYGYDIRNSNRPVMV
ncbi:hypothetical protein LSAT2_024724 [Lamellibrachia satsuma]|nr:hypothetical protein LSAT2_024724 [Lamellibrachia satsuma]